MTNVSPNYISGKIYISEVKDSYFTFYYKFNKYIAYNKLDIKPGDILEINATKSMILSPSYEGDFNTLTFIRGKNVKAIYDIESYQITNYFFNFNRIRYLILNFYKTRIDSNYFDLFSCLVLGENNLNELTTYTNLNILHILALSGFHLLIIYNFTFNLLFKLTKKYTLSENIALGIIFLYTLLCGSSPSLLRAFIFLLVKKLKQKLNLKLTNLDLYSLTFLILLIKPLTIYNIGFIFSQLASFIILYMPALIKTKNKLLKNIYSNLIFLSISFPFITNMTNALSLFSLLSFIFSYIFSVIFIPLMFIFLIIQSLSHYLTFLIMGFNIELEFVSNILVIHFPYMNNIFKLIYYLILFFIFYFYSLNKKKRIINLSYFVLLIFYLIYPNLTYKEIIFLDVGQGDSTFIKNGNSIYLIDCYNALDYLDKRGISKIEAIFISHSDSDHLGDLETILKEIKVNKVYYSFYDEVTPTLLNNTIGIPLKFGDIITLDDLKIKVLSGMVSYSETNLNSLILEFYFNGYNYLFTGDTTIEVEETILPYLSDIDVLKVAHHGSSTSSSIEFLEQVRPEIAIVSVAYNNRYGLPDIEVINRLKRYADVYLTYKCGNIKIKEKSLTTYK